MNQFEALCRLASDENWCWNLYCTTCGHLHFKYAFDELAKGKSPEDKDWIIHSDETKYHILLGPQSKQDSLSKKENVLNICLDANIHSIANSCNFPDWLGYLGLVLVDMFTNAQIYKSVCDRWASQLKELVPEHSHIHSRLSEIVDSDNMLLNIKDLEACEMIIQQRLV